MGKLMGLSAYGQRNDYFYEIFETILAGPITEKKQEKFEEYIDLNRYKNIEYCINEVRQRIVDSWPDNIDDSLACSEWNWRPDLNLQDTLIKYLQEQE